MWIALTLVLGLATPIDVTDRMFAPPRHMTLNFEHNLIDGDPRATMHATLRAHLPAIEPCLQRLALRPHANARPSLSLTVRPDGIVERVELLGASKRAEACLQGVVPHIRFSVGTRRSGIIALRRSPPRPLPPGVTLMAWRVVTDYFEAELSVSSRRSFSPWGQPEGWNLVLEGRVTPTRYAVQFLRPTPSHDFEYRQADGRIVRGSTLDHASSEDDCLPLSATMRIVRNPVKSIRRGEVYRARFFATVGPCGKPKRRYELGSIELDWRDGPEPVFRVVPQTAAMSEGPGRR